MYRSSTVYKQKQSKSSALNKHVGAFWRERTEGIDLNVKTLDDGFVSYKQCFSIYKMFMIDMLIDTFELFLSAVGTLCRESIGKQVM